MEPERSLLTTPIRRPGSPNGLSKGHQVPKQSEKDRTRSEPGFVRRARRKSRFSLRTRVLTIALTPSVVLLAAGVGINTYLLTGAVERRDTAALLSDGYAMAVPFMPAMSEERRASIAMAADPSPRTRRRWSRRGAGSPS